MSTPNIIELVRERIGNRTQSAFAHEIGIGESYLCDVLKGRRDPGPTFLEAMGLRKVVTYEPATGRRKAR